MTMRASLSTGGASTVVLPIRNAETDGVGRPIVGEVEEVAQRCAALPVLDDRSLGESIGYDGAGVLS